MSFFLFNSCAKFGGGNGGGEKDQAETAVVTVGSTPITAEQITNSLNQMATQGMMGSTGAPTFETIAMAAPGALTQSLSQSAYQVLAEQNHVNLSDDVVLAAAKGMLEGMQPPSAKPDPKKDELMNRELANLKAALADPNKKALVLGELTPRIVQDQMIAAYPVTPDAIKKSFDSYQIKQIFVSGPDAKTKADQAAKAVKGGMSFEDAMNKYSSNPPEKGKKISDSKMDLPASEISLIPSFKPAEGKAAGFVSDPTPDRGGFTILKVVSVTNKAPKDFATDPNKYKKQVAQDAVGPKIQADIKAILESNSVKWNSPGYKALYDLTKVQQSQDMAGRDAALKKVVDAAKAAAQGNGDRMPALYAWFDAESLLYRSAGDKAKMSPDRIEVLKAVLQSSEDYALRMELIGLYIEQKDGADALQNLVQASQANTTYDVQGQNNFRDIGAKASQLTVLKLVPPDQLAALTTAQDAWKKGKSDYDKMQAQMKEDEAKQKVLDAANKKQNDALIAKQKADAAKSGVKPSQTPQIKVTPVPPKASQ